MAKQDANNPVASKSHQDGHGAARQVGNVWPLFGPDGASGRGRAAEHRPEESRVDSAGLLSHDASPPASDNADARGSPLRRHTMPRLALEALGPEGLSRQHDAGVLEPPSKVFDWNHAPNDRLAAEGRQSRLARTLEVDIIPRLVKVHRALPGAQGAQGAGPAPGAQDVEDFVQLVLAGEHLPSRAFVETLQKRGMSTETLYLDLLAPAAQHLNYLWAQDLCDFTEVTLGLARLQRLLHEFSPSLREEELCRGNARRVLLMPVSGEHQTFGLSMLAEFFHHAGWEVDCGKSSEHDDAAELVRLDWFDIVGLTAGIDTHLEDLRQRIRNVRSCSRNKDIGVLVGGPIFAAHPERVKFVGADACGLDGKQALLNAEKLMATRGLDR